MVSGLGDTNDRQVPTLVKDVCNVGSVSCGKLAFVNNYLNLMNLF